MKVQKQEALQLLKKKEKTDNIIKVAKHHSILFAFPIVSSSNIGYSVMFCTMQKTKEKKKKEKEGKTVDPNKPKKPTTSFLFFRNEMREQLMQQKPGTNNATLSAMISVQWKVNYHF